MSESIHTTTTKTTNSIETKHLLKIKKIHLGPAVLIGALFSALFALLSGIPPTLVTIAISRLFIRLLSPIINLFRGSVSDAINGATGTTFSLFLIYVIVVILFGSIFTCFAILLYNLLARWTGGLSIDVDEVYQEIVTMTVTKPVSPAEERVALEGEAEGERTAPSGKIVEEKESPTTERAPSTEEVADPDTKDP
jgi:hypothetical protein